MKEIDTNVNLATLANVYGSLQNENFEVNTARFIERVKVVSGLTSDKEVEDCICRLVNDKKENGDFFSSKLLFENWKSLVSAAVSDWLGEEGQRLKDLPFTGVFFKDKENLRKDAFSYIFTIYGRGQASQKDIQTFFKLNYDEYGRLDLELREEKKHVVIVSILESFFAAVKIRSEKNQLDLETCINRFHENCSKDIVGYPYSKRKCNELIQMVHDARQAKNHYHPPKVLPADIFKKIVKALFVLSVLQRERQNSADMKKSLKGALMLWYKNHKDQFSIDEEFRTAFWGEDQYVQMNVHSFLETMMTINQTSDLWSVLKNIDNQGNFLPCADDKYNTTWVKSFMERCLHTVICNYGFKVESGKSFNDSLSIFEKISAHIWLLKKSGVFDDIEKSYTATNDASCQYERLLNGPLPMFLLLIATICQTLDRYKTGIVFYRKPMINPLMKIIVRNTASEKERNVRDKAPWYISINTNKWKSLKKTEEVRDVIVAIGDKQINVKIKVKIDSWTMVGLGCESGRQPSVTILEDIKYPGVYFNDEGVFIASEEEFKDLEPERVEDTEEEESPNDSTDNEIVQKDEKSVETQLPTPKVENVELRYDGSLMTMSCATRKVDIYYTLDGSVPTTASTWYLSPFTIKPNQWPFWVRQKKIVKAIAVKEGYDNSDVATMMVPLKYPITLWLILLAAFVALALALIG